MDITLTRIVDQIKEKGITEKQFLFDLGLNKTLLSDWKAGRVKSYVRHIDRIAEYLGVSTDYLLGRTDYRYADTFLAAGDAEGNVITSITDEEKAALEAFLEAYRAAKKKE